MQRISIAVEDDLSTGNRCGRQKERGCKNRSEIIRGLARAGPQQSAANAAPSRHCVVALVYVYDHAACDLSKQLVQAAIGSRQYRLDHRHASDRQSYQPHRPLQTAIGPGKPTGGDRKRHGNHH